MTINTDLLLQIREQITSHPETHDQNSWGEKASCGTTHCIAGWAAVFTGAALDWRGSEGALLATVNGLAPDDYATRELRLSEVEADDLFQESDNAESLVLLDRLIEKGKNGL